MAVWLRRAALLLAARPGFGASPPIVFIHVGKCGGSTLERWLHARGVKHTQIHTESRNLPSSGNVDARLRYMLMLRDPVQRFQSAYEYARLVVQVNTTGMGAGRMHRDVHSGRSYVCALGPGCPSPGHLTKKVLSGKNYTYSNRLDELLLHFHDANELGEALSCRTAATPGQQAECELARQLVSSTESHINKGAGYYLGNGSFLRSLPPGNVFVGTLEHIDEDLVLLARWLGLPEGKNSTPSAVFRSTGASATPELSARARHNIRCFYEFNAVSPDYAAMRALVRHGLLNASRYDLSRPVC